MPIFAKASELGINYRQGTEAQGADPQNACKFASRLCQRRQRTFGKNDLVIGNELGCRYGWRRFPVYEIVTVARPAHRLLYFFMQ